MGTRNVRANANASQDTATRIVGVSALKTGVDPSALVKVLRVGPEMAS